MGWGLVLMAHVDKSNYILLKYAWVFERHGVSPGNLRGNKFIIWLEAVAAQSLRFCLKCQSGHMFCSIFFAAAPKAIGACLTFSGNGDQKVQIGGAPRRVYSDDMGQKWDECKPYRKAMSSGSWTENVSTNTHVTCRENHHKVLMSQDPSINEPTQSKLCPEIWTVISGWMGNQLYVTPPNGHLPAIENCDWNRIRNGDFP